MKRKLNNNYSIRYENVHKTRYLKTQKELLEANQTTNQPFTQRTNQTNKEITIKKPKKEIVTQLVKREKSLKINLHFFFQQSF